MSSPEQRAEFVNISRSLYALHRLSSGDTLAYLGSETVDRLLAEVEALEQRIADIAEAGLFDAETQRHRVDVLEAKLAAVRAWSIQWGRDTRRAMALDALTTILAVDAQADHEAVEQERGEWQ